jgi:hypothetical protein
MFLGHPDPLVRGMDPALDPAPNPDPSLFLWTEIMLAK